MNSTDIKLSAIGVFTDSPVSIISLARLSSRAKAVDLTL